MRHGGLGDERADEEACGHAGKAEEEGLLGDLIDRLERGSQRRVGIFVSGGVLE